MTGRLVERRSTDGRRVDIKTVSGIPEHLIITPPPKEPASGL